MTSAGLCPDATEFAVQVVDGDIHCGTRPESVLRGGRRQDGGGGHHSQGLWLARPWTRGSLWDCPKNSRR